MYLVLRRPWDHRVATVASDGPPVVMVGNDAGVTRPRPKKKRRPTGGSPVQPGPPSPLAGEVEADEPEPTPLTAADRALESRGDTTALPAQTIDLAGGGREARALDDGEINATINNQAGAVKDCVVQGATGTDLRATITVTLVVDGHGHVARSRIQAPHYLFEHGLLGCTQRALGRMHFPATGGATLVTLPVNLGG
jgi:hypothetical protein